MNNEIYKGDSEGFNYLVDGYMDYSKEVIARRAIPDIRDGLKPVQRRIVYSAKKIDKKQFQKCSVFVAEAMKLHPHGDSSVYGSMVLMTDNNGSWNYPVMQGMGNLGKVYSSNPPAAFRYPKAKLHPFAEEFFKEQNLMKLVPSEEGDGVEPEVLLPSFPNVLVNGTSGIAVSVGTRIPSFNFHDVIDMTIKYIKNGKLELDDVIYPDFPTGGVLVKSDSETTKIMQTGKGKLKIRATVEIVGKEIIVKEVPFGKTFEGIVSSIKNAEIREIKSVMNLTGNSKGKEGSGGQVSIICKSKSVVEYVLMELYRKGILQTTFASNILVINKGNPYIMGVHGIIEEWVKFRRNIIKKKFETELKASEDEMRTLSYFIRLISNEEWKDTYIAKATKVSKKEADAYLHEIFEDIPDDVCTWINGRAISAFNKGGKYSTRYDDLSNYVGYCSDMLANPDVYILNELVSLKQRNKDNFKRKTEISKIDYKFSKISNSEAMEDDSYCVYTMTNDGFIKKTREWSEDENILCQFEGRANSQLVGFDNYGRVVRVSGAEIPFTSIGDNGTYLPKVFDASIQDDYRVLYMCVCDGSKKMLVYRDGYIGFFDTSEWLGKKINKVITKGVPLAVMDKLLEVYDEKDIPQCLVFIDDSGKHMKLGIVNTETILPKSRSSRTKVLSGGSNINTEYIAPMSYMESYENIQNAQLYYGKLRVADDSVFIGDVDVEEGKYLAYCTDI